MPEGSRRKIIARHGPAKPKRSASKVAPNPRPIAIIKPYRRPAIADTDKHRNTAKNNTAADVKNLRGLPPAIGCARSDKARTQFDEAGS